MLIVISETIQRGENKKINNLLYFFYSVSSESSQLKINPENEAFQWAAQSSLSNSDDYWISGGGVFGML